MIQHPMFRSYHMDGAYLMYQVCQKMNIYKYNVDINKTSGWDCLSGNWACSVTVSFCHTTCCGPYRFSEEKTKHICR